MKLIVPDTWTTHEIKLELQASNPCGDDTVIEQPSWGIRWAMEPEANQPVMYEGTLRHVWIPENITDFLTQFLREFDEKWQAYSDLTNGHLDRHVSCYITSIPRQGGTDCHLIASKCISR
jgi:hypothetical protein